MDCPGTTAAGHAVASQVTTMTVMVVDIRLRTKTRRQGWRWWSIPFERGLHREASDLGLSKRGGGNTWDLYTLSFVVVGFIAYNMNPKNNSFVPHNVR